MDKKLKLWKSIRKWISIGWLLWGVSIICSQFIVLSEDFDWITDCFMGFLIVWPFLFFVLLFLTYYETNQIYDKEYNKDKKQDPKKIKSFVYIIKPTVIFFDILWILWMIIPNLSWGFCYNCMTWAHYLKILLLIGNVYLLIDINKVINTLKSFLSKK